MELPAPPRSRRITVFTKQQRDLAVRIADAMAGEESDTPLLEPVELGGEGEESPAPQQQVVGTGVSSAIDSADLFDFARDSSGDESGRLGARAARNYNMVDQGDEWHPPASAGRKLQDRRTSERLANKRQQRKKVSRAKSKLVSQPKLEPQPTPVRKSKSNGRAKAKSGQQGRHLPGRSLASRAMAAGWIRGSGASLHALKPRFDALSLLEPPVFLPAERCAVSPGKCSRVRPRREAACGWVGAAVASAARAGASRRGIPWWPVASATRRTPPSRRKRERSPCRCRVSRRRPSAGAWTAPERWTPAPWTWSTEGLRPPASKDCVFRSVEKCTTTRTGV